MKKKITLLLLSIVLMPCLLLLAACNKSVEFKINFIVDNEVYDTISTTGNTTISMPDDPIKEGYTFDGWYWDNDVWSRPFTANSLLDTPLVKDLRVYAKFSEIHAHSIVVIDAVEPTCTSSGNQKYYKCSTCNKLFSDETATTEITQIPVLAKLSHIYGDWQITKTATCTSDGLKIKKCTLCGETLQNEIINATGHTPSAWNITKQPTCTEYGTKIKTCTTCNAIVESENINPNGHVFSNWVITKQPTYTELGQEKRTCQNCSHYETRNIPTLTPTYVEPTRLILENGILKWNGSSPFGFELIVNNQSYIVQDNEFETTLKSDDYNSAKVACIYVDNTKSTYIELNNFILNAPITNLHFVDDGTNVKFTWDSPSDLYDYTFIYNNIEKTVSKTQHYYSVPRNQLQKGTEISIFVQGLSSANFYPSKKYTITLDQLDAPNLKIDKLNVEWDNIPNAQEYKVQALNTLTQTSTIYNYDGANDGEYSITVTAFGSDYLNNSATLTFTKLKKPTINIENNIVTWDAIAGQVRYAVLIDDVETKFVGNSYTIQNTNSEYNIYLYASPVQPNTMQSDRVIISKFTYEQYSSVYYGNIVGDTLNYFNVVDQTILYVPDKIIDSCNFSSFKNNAILIASKVPSGLNKQYITQIIVPNGIQTIPEQTFERCDYATKISLPDSLTTIGANAFSNCSKLIEIIIPNNVTSIGDSAFSCCSELISVVFEGSSKLINIGDSAFSGCSSLIEITIPQSVTSIGYSAFGKCSSLTKITLPFVGNGSDKTHFGYIFGASAYDYNYSCVPNTLREVVITGSNNIGSSAFYNCSNITSITIPESVTSIDNYAFNNCSSLTSVNMTNLSRWIEIDFKNWDSNPLYYAKNLYLNDKLVDFEDVIIPREVRKIGSFAFYNFNNLKTISFEDGSLCESIGSSSFYGCSNLSNIIIPSSVTSIGSNAFNNCSNLTEITIPDSVTSIGISTFYNCSSLTRVNMTNLFRWLEIEFGNYYANPLYYAKNLYLNNELVVDVVIPKEIAKINAYVFYNAECLKTITFEDGSKCESVGNSAFENCSNITSITIPDSVTSIGNYAFSSCTKLTEIIIPESVTIIGYGAFRNCSSVTKITLPFIGNGSDKTHFGYIFGADTCNDNSSYVPKTLKEVVITGSNNIGNSAFYKCSNITSITIPESVTSIGYSAFYNCSSLTRVNITDLSRWLEIDFENETANPLYYAKNFYLNNELVNENIIIPKDIKEIRDYAFYNCTNLKTISFEDGSICGSIGYSAFRGCSSLTKITLAFIGNGSDKTHFGYIFGASSYDSNYSYVPKTLKEVVITGSNNIGNYAFYNCSNITSITIPSCVTIIGKSAFSGCTKITEITIPNSVTSIGESAFSGCSGVTEIVLPLYITSIGNYAFDYCSNITSITIPSSVTIIGDGAFRGCSNLTSITIPDSVTSIGDYAFNKCSRLTEITISSSVTSIGAGAFGGCSSLTKITLPFVGNGSDKTHFGYIFGASTFDSNSDYVPITLKEVVITGDNSISNYAFYGCSNISSITIPESVASIDSYAFYNCTSLTNITIPESVASIGSYAFYNCTSLTNITIPESVTSIDSYAFYNCTSLTSITIPESVASIGSYAFYNCTSLTNITIPESVTSIGSYAFYKCSNITSITIPNSVTSIGSYAFEYCSRLTRVNITNLSRWLEIEFGNYNANPLYYTKNLYLNNELVDLENIIIPNDVKKIGSYMFNIFTNLKTISFEEGSVCESIGKCAFSSCSSLTEIIIPNTIKSINENAFSYCSSLKIVYYSGNQEDWNNITIDSENSCLTGATRYYYSETEPTTIGNYWHYVDGVVTEWKKEG